eukprot:m.226501 g.226501  ORF g.226501 m.226501 type:complete len:422 (+) comp40029_c0_seq17:652-1917(+)
MQQPTMLQSSGYAVVRRLCQKMPTLSSWITSYTECDKTTNDLISEYSENKPRPLTLRQFTNFAELSNKNVVNSFKFLRKEVPVRLAHIMKEIDLLPETLLSTRSMKLVRGWYVQSFQDVVRFHRDCLSNQASARFTSVIDTIKQRHADIVKCVAEGLVEMKEMHGEEILEDQRDEIQYFLDRFLMSRISIRMLLSHHLALFGGECSSPGSFGVIDPRCNIFAIASEARENAQIVCEHFNLCSPDVVFSGDKNLTIPYIPCHLHHILFELLKNSFRAVVESRAESENLPPVNILIKKGEEDIIITVSDKGGGIGRRLLEKIFHYSYTTAPIQKPDAVSKSSMAPLAGYGYGLPISRLYARYFNGELVLTSVEGEGTDVIVYLKALSGDAVEFLPVFNHSLKKHYEHKRLPADWSIQQTNTVS